MPINFRLAANAETYLQPDHPLQRQIRQIISRATRIEQDGLIPGVDGCGLPTYAAPLRAFATAYATIADPAAAWDAANADALLRPRAAILAHPELISGDGEIDTELMRLAEGRLLAKLGAEGLLCLALPERGLGIAIKEESGSTRALGPAAVRMPEALDLLDTRILDVLRERYWTAVRTFAGAEAGRVRSTFTLEPC